MVGIEQAAAAGSEFSCKEVEMALGGVILTLSAALVTVVKIGWNMMVGNLKDARDHNSALEVTLNSAKQKKAESPK